MKKNIIVFFVLLSIIVPVPAAVAMLKPAKVLQTQTESSVQPTDSNTSELIKSAVQEICDGNFIVAGQILSKTDANNPNISALSSVISQYKKIESVKQQSQKKSFDEQFAELEKFKAAADKNEPNLLEVFPAIIKADELATDEQKKQILSDKFVQKTIERARKTAGEFESKGNWLNSLIYCYSWLSALYEEDKTIQDKKKGLEEKLLIEASLADNSCEACSDRFQKVKPQMFTRSLDVLEYGYVEPFYYSDMADKVFDRCRNLADVLQFSDSNKSPVTVSADSPQEILPDSAGGKVTITFLKDKLPEFAAGLDSLRKKYSSEPTGMNKDQFTKLFEEVQALNLSTINLPEQIIVWHFSEAALSALDPHTMIVWPKEKEDFEKSMTNEFSGIGVEISKADGLLRAASLLPDTPAYYSGMDAGDIIEAINGESTRDMPITCAVSKITGPAGTKVVLTVRSSTEEKVRTIEITRAKIVVPTIRGWRRNDSGDWQYFVDEKEKIGYVRATNFSASTSADLNRVLNILESTGMRALILDLRFNTGGFLKSAVEIADMFIENGVIVSTQPRIGPQSWEVAHKKGTHPNYPIVILINGGSASASEIVAGALADNTYRRATLVGQQSYGKGSVQTISDYPGDGAEIKFTMAYYHLPDGRKVSDRASAEKKGRKDWGIIPNVKVEMSNEELKKLIDVEKDNDVLVAANRNKSRSKLKKHNLAETLQADPQLAVAVLVSKAKLIEAGLQ
ncbi:MAG: S41 family peptidase [Sedimentisphaerales bacterium]